MSRVLIIVDVQNDFCQGGSLAVPHSNEIFKYVNALKKHKTFFSHVIFTRDWHPQKHISFASRHGKQPFTDIQINGKNQELWPDHCVVNTKGAEFSPLQELEGNQIVISKGTDIDVDAYSGFGSEQLNQKLIEFNAKEVYVVGLAFDFCVGYTALDAKKRGYDTYIVREGTKPVSQQSASAMEQMLKQNNVHLISFDSICSL